MQGDKIVRVAMTVGDDYKVDYIWLPEHVMKWLTGWVAFVNEKIPPTVMSCTVKALEVIGEDNHVAETTS